MLCNCLSSCSTTLRWIVLVAATFVVFIVALLGAAVMIADLMEHKSPPLFCDKATAHPYISL